MAYTSELLVVNPFPDKSGMSSGRGWLSSHRLRQDSNMAPCATRLRCFLFFKPLIQAGIAFCHLMIEKKEKN